MKAFIILALVAVAAADVSHIVNSEKNAEIVEQSADVFPDQYQFGFKTSNGIAAQESGAVVNVGKENEAISVQGSNQHTAPDGSVISLRYTADDTGYHPEGSHLPTPPAPLEIPDYILRSLAYIAAHPPQPTKP